MLEYIQHVPCKYKISRYKNMRQVTIISKLYEDWENSSYLIAYQEISQHFISLFLLEDYPIFFKWFVVVYQATNLCLTL